jgi:hypothetical protein
MMVVIKAARSTSPIIPLYLLIRDMLSLLAGARCPSSTLHNERGAPSSTAAFPADIICASVRMLPEGVA